MEKVCAKPHLHRAVESVEVLEFEMDFCYLLQDTKRRHQPGDQAWATTLVMVDVAAQNPLCAALSTKYDEKAYLSAMCAAFVKRMALATAVLKVDPELALELLADKIALRASADGIPLKVETAPRFCSQSTGALRLEGVDEEIVRTILGSKTKDFDVVEPF